MKKLRRYLMALIAGLTMMMMTGCGGAVGDAIDTYNESSTEGDNDPTFTPLSESQVEMLIRLTQQTRLTSALISRGFGIDQGNTYLEEAYQTQILYSIYPRLDSELDARNRITLNQDHTTFDLPEFAELYSNSINEMKQGVPATFEILIFTLSELNTMQNEMKGAFPPMVEEILIDIGPETTRLINLYENGLSAL